MRHIWDSCNKGQDTVKLRLRGYGSTQNEIEQQKETDYLHL